MKGGDAHGGDLVEEKGRRSGALKADRELRRGPVGGEHADGGG